MVLEAFGSYGAHLIFLSDCQHCYRDFQPSDAYYGPLAYGISHSLVCKRNETIKSNIFNKFMEILRNCDGSYDA